MISILGGSGSGKSTLLRAIAGLVTPTVGTIEVSGTVVVSDGVERVPAAQRRLGMMFQNYALFPFMTVAENVAYGIRGEPDHGSRVDTLLNMVGLSELRDRHPGELSGGQQQRVALVRALAPRPVAMLLDEPFANLDGVLRQTVRDDVARLLRQEGVPGLLVTHDQTEALSWADRVAVIGPDSPGEPATVLQLTEPHRAYRNPEHLLVARLTGPLIELNGSAVGSHADTPLGRVTLNRDIHGEVLLGVRPDQVNCVPDSAGSSDIREVQFAGGYFRIRVMTPVGQLWLHSVSEPPPCESKVTLAIAGEGMVLSQLN